MYDKPVVFGEFWVGVMDDGASADITGILFTDNAVTLTVPVNVGEAKGANKFNAVCVAVDIGLSISDVLLILEIDVKGANKFNAVCVAVDIGFNKSDVLLTLIKPTIVFEIPLTYPLNVVPVEDIVIKAVVDDPPI